jgi:hypothetical protein
VWERDPAQTTVAVASAKPLASVEIDGGIWMDATPADNRWSAQR